MKKLLLLLIIFTSSLSFSQTKSQINEVLKNVSDKINQTLPMTIDEYTTLMTTYGGFGRVIYSYKVDASIFSDFNMSVNEWKKSQSQQIKNSFCSDPDFEFYRKYDVDVSWNYRDLEGNFVHTVKLNSSDCN